MDSSASSTVWAVSSCSVCYMATCDLGCCRQHCSDDVFHAKKDLLKEGTLTGKTVSLAHHGMSFLKAMIKPRKQDISGAATLIYSKFFYSNNSRFFLISHSQQQCPLNTSRSHWALPNNKQCSDFFQGASVVWAWFTPITPAPCPSPSSTCPSTSTGSSLGRASVSSSSASSSVVTASGKGQQQTAGWNLSWLEELSRELKTV